MSDLDQVLSGEAPEANEPVQPVEAEQPQEAQAESQPEQPEAAPEQPEAVEPTVPLAVFKSMRDDLKTQLDQIKTQMQQPQQVPEQPQAPEFLDPEGAQFQQRQMATMAANMQAEMSERFARMQHGDDAVNAAMEAAQASGTVDQFRGQKDPWGKLVTWHKTQQVAQEIGPDPAAYRQKLEAEIRQKIQAEMAAKQAQEMAAKQAPSLAGVNGTGGNSDPGWQGPSDLNSLIGE